MSTIATATPPPHAHSSKGKVYYSCLAVGHTYIYIQARSRAPHALIYIPIHWYTYTHLQGMRYSEEYVLK